MQAESQAPKELSQAHSDGAPLWNSRDQKATPLGPQEMAKNHIFQLCSFQVIKVKVLRVEGRAGARPEHTTYLGSGEWWVNVLAHSLSCC